MHDKEIAVSDKQTNQQTISQARQTQVLENKQINKINKNLKHTRSSNKLRPIRNESVEVNKKKRRQKPEKYCTFEQAWLRSSVRYLVRDGLLLTSKQGEIRG